MHFRTNKIAAVLVFLEKRKARHFVGRLSKEDQLFCFEYYDNYLNARNVIPLGPELPMTRKKWKSETLFTSFVDRIPSRENPAYPEYCRATGISVGERDPFLLLTTIGKRGPSSFIFEQEYGDTFSNEDLREFRKQLGMTTREFAYCFEFTQAGISRVEKGQSSGRDILKRVEIYAYFPEVALEQITRHGGILHSKKRKKVYNTLKKLKNTFAT